MPRFRAIALMGCLVLLLAACGDQNAVSQGVDALAPSTTQEAAATTRGDTAPRSDPGPIPDRVGVSDGTRVRGFVSQSAIDARDHRNLAWATGPDGFSTSTGTDGTLDANERRQALLAARSLVDPVEVTDDAGTLVGYFAHDFVSLEDYPARLGEAKALLADEAARRAAER